MKLRDRLKSPFALVLQGFAAGALLFFGSQPLAENAPAPSAPAAAGSVLDSLQA
jgi:hypothetical protein